MSLLEKYLTEEYPFDLRDISDVEAILQRAVTAFCDENNFDDANGWPYDVRMPKESAKLFSANTTAMIINALLRYTGQFDSADKLSIYNHHKVNIFALKDAKKKCDSKYIVKALKLLGDNIYKNNVLNWTSVTYGNKDVFTLAWLAEICKAVLFDTSSECDKKLWTQISKEVHAAVIEKMKTDADDVSKLIPNNDGSALHSFPVLRLVQAARRSDDSPSELNFASRYKFFQNLLHEQLSFSAIPDSRFDPAELVFCLEGMLICDFGSVDRTIFDRVLEVLSQEQSKSAFWRPVKPFLATPTGFALFPISVEIANSLMRSCSIYDKDLLHDTYGSKCVKLLRRYWQWLRARSVTIKRSNAEYVGWHSEHVNQSGLIQLWETSQVMGFLMSYRNLLQSHIARITLTLSRVKQEKRVSTKWEKIQAESEAVSSMGNKLKIYSSIGEDFIEPHLAGKPQNYSMLLYGPPGTGKTRIAESIAEALNLRLITITVSDFLASGGAQVEARAKDVFSVLMAQPACVVLFDEIDHFLLNRDSDRYAKQDTVFQFMTPGMLTKLNDLRSTENIIFIVATNYEDRIDAAIKRTGRIDKKYLVLPPDGDKRMAQIEAILKNKLQITDEQKAKIKASSLYLGYSDIKASMLEFAKKTPLEVDVLNEILRSRARTTSLEGYNSRFAKVEDLPPNISETPMAEFLSLVALKMVVDPEFTDIERRAMKAANECLQTVTVDKIKKNAPDLSEEHAQAVCEAFRSINLSNSQTEATNEN